MASIRDVAKHAGVAACTVSRVLNGSGYVAPETKEKIEKAMSELQYIPNELARGMFRQKAGIVAMLVPNIRHPFFSSLAENIEQALYENGYKLMLCSTDNRIEREREYMNMLKSNIVDGVILGVNSLEDEVYLEFNKPLIMLDYLVGGRIPTITSNHRQGGELAADIFMKNTCRYVIHICDETETPVVSYQSHQALEEKLKKAGIYSRAVPIQWEMFDFNGYLELAKTILTEYPQIDGIMAADMPCAAFLKAAVQLGKKVPEELKLISYDGTYVVNVNTIEITTIVQPIHEISEKIIAVMDEMITGGSTKGENIQFDVQVKKGDTTI